MNIALEKTEEHANGQLRRNYGDAFVRGNNGPSLPTASEGRKLRTLMVIQSCTSLRTRKRAISTVVERLRLMSSKDSIALAFHGRMIEGTVVGSCS